MSQDLMDLSIPNKQSIGDALNKLKHGNDDKIQKSVNEKLSLLAKKHLIEVEELFFEKFPRFNELHEKHAQNCEISIKTNAKVGFFARYYWDKNLIVVSTPENLNELSFLDIEHEKVKLSTLGHSDRSIHDLSRRTINWNVLLHEDFHNIFTNIFKTKYPDMHDLDAIYAFNESFAILAEYMLIEIIENDKNCKLTNQEKDECKFITNAHLKIYKKQKLEDSIDSRYTMLDDRMIFIKIYKKFGELGIIDFIEKMDFIKISTIIKYKEDKDSKVLTESYKNLLDMDAQTLVNEFTRMKLA